jgi:hypothetical protein
MSFHILYVENWPKDFKKLDDVIKEYNREDSPASEKIELSWAKDLEELENQLDYKIDVVLADMYLTPSESDKGDRLQEVIDKVKAWCERNNVGRPIPIIAYTISGEDAFKAKKDLYDIWDKNTASVEYVTWRLSKLSIELSRIRPDASIQTKIRTDLEAECCVRWHDAVLDMIKRYNQGWTESDQIDRAGKAVETIADRLNSWADIQPMWKVVKDWEFFGRAVSPRVRGHARHALNVFWLGYYLINHKNLRDFFLSRWEDLKDERSQMKIVRKEKSHEAINNVWFYTSLFHDIAGCLEKFLAIDNFRRDLYSPFEGLDLNISTIPYFSTKKIRKNAIEFLVNFNDPLNTILKDSWEKSLKEQKADHGMLAALYLRQRINDNKQNCYAREAGRAIAVHSLIGRIKEEKIDNLTWEKEPFACLLLLCDQLQTWERERGDTRLSDNDGPERSELAELQIEPGEMTTDGNPGKLPHLKIAIDYIAPPHLRHAPEIYQRVKDDLDFILRDKPHRALSKIAGEWPFLLNVNFFFSKDPLNAFIEIHPDKEK